MRYTIALIIVAFSFVTPAIASSPFDTSSEPFAADVYPSRKTTIDRLAQQVIREMGENATLDVNNMTIQFSREGITTDELSESVIAPVHQAFAGAKIER